jgi:hypothetical protein
MVVSRRYATLVETQTVLGVQDIYDLIEVIAVDAHNENLKPRE